MTNRRAWVLSALGIALAACGGNKEAGQAAGNSTGATTGAAAASGKNKITIAVIAKSSTNPVFLAARTGAEAAAKELSAKNNINVSVVWLTPPQEDGQVQAQ